MKTSLKRQSRFAHFSTEKLLNLTASPYQITEVGTDYGHLMDADNVAHCEAHQVLWQRQARLTQAALIAHQAGLDSWDDFLDAQGVPPIPDDYWDRYYADITQQAIDAGCPF